MLDKVKAWASANVDKKAVVNSVLGAAAFGAVIWGAKKSGIGVAKKAATIATGGSK